MRKFLFLTLLAISSLLQAEEWTGTGWALKDGYIVTNYHCVDGAKSIRVNSSQSDYSAKVVATDPSSDLAIIKIDDEKFSGFGEIPYSIERKPCEVGETVWTLGYPMTSIMGAEVKFTDGKISAKTGYMGDLSTYQITVPIHPGNSGGPLFNKNGNIVGITSSGLDKQLADNVNYAIKTNYLLNLIESAISIDIIPHGSVKNLALTEYVSRNKKFVFLLHFCSGLNENETRKNAETCNEISPQETHVQNPAIVNLLEFVEIAENKVKIAKYNGNWQEVEIPSVIIKDGKRFYVTEIAANVFNKNLLLKKITIPSTIESIEYGAFWGCSGLKSIEVMIGNTVYDSRNKCNAIIETATNTLIVGCQNTTIPTSITSISKSAFSGCSSLTSVTIPNSVTSIGDGAFYGCSSLTSVSIPNSVTSIGDGAFYGCSSLTSVTIPNSVTSIGDGAFYGCSSLTSVTIPDSVTNIGERAFYYCSSLTSVTIPNGVTSIGESAFSGCSSLTAVTIPKNVTSIGSLAFASCSSLTSIIIPNSVTSIGNMAFYNCDNLISVTIGNCVTSIGNLAFADCSSLTSIAIPENVTSIGSEAFDDCSSLTSISMSDNVKKIGKSAFRGCISLKAITLSNNLVVIEAETFKDCQSLTSITIPLNVETIEKRAFIGCTSLKSITWNAIRSSATEITKGEYASPFLDVRSQISSIEFGDSVQYIPSYLCFDMINIQSVIIPKSVTTIDKYAFWNCSSLSNIMILSSVDKICENAFGYVAKSPRVTFLGRVNEMWGMFGTWSYNPYYDALIFYTTTEYLSYYKSQRKQILLKKTKVTYKIKE